MRNAAYTSRYITHAKTFPAMACSSPPRRKRCSSMSPSAMPSPALMPKMSMASCTAQAMAKEQTTGIQVLSLL